MLCSNHSYSKSNEIPALIDSDVDSVGTGSVGDDEADDQPDLSSEPGLNGYCKSYVETTANIDTSFLCYCDIFNTISQLESFCNGDQHEEYFGSSSSTQPYEQFCLRESFNDDNKNIKKQLILNRISATKMRKRLDYMALECKPHSRIHHEKISTIDDSYTFFYDSEPNLLVTCPSNSPENVCETFYSQTLPFAESHDNHLQENTYPTNKIPCSNSYIEMTSDSSNGLINVCS